MALDGSALQFQQETDQTADAVRADRWVTECKEESRSEWEFLEADMETVLDDAGDGDNEGNRGNTTGKVEGLSKDHGGDISSDAVVVGVKRCSVMVASNINNEGVAGISDNERQAMEALQGTSTDCAVYQAAAQCTSRSEKRDQDMSADALTNCGQAEDERAGAQKCGRAATHGDAPAGGLALAGEDAQANVQAKRVPGGRTHSSDGVEDVEQRGWEGTSEHARGDASRPMDLTEAGADSLEGVLSEGEGRRETAHVAEEEGGREKTEEGIVAGKGCVRSDGAGIGARMSISLRQAKQEARRLAPRIKGCISSSCSKRGRDEANQTLCATDSKKADDPRVAGSGAPHEAASKKQRVGFSDRVNSGSSEGSCGKLQHPSGGKPLRGSECDRLPPALSPTPSPSFLHSSSCSSSSLPHVPASLTSSVPATPSCQAAVTHTCVHQKAGGPPQGHADCSCGRCTPRSAHQGVSVSREVASKDGVMTTKTVLVCGTSTTVETHGSTPETSYCCSLLQQQEQLQPHPLVSLDLWKSTAVTPQAEAHSVAVQCPAAQPEVRGAPGALLRTAAVAAVSMRHLTLGGRAVGGGCIQSITASTSAHACITTAGQEHPPGHVQACQGARQHAAVPYGPVTAAEPTRPFPGNMMDGAMRREAIPDVQGPDHGSGLMEAYQQQGQQQQQQGQQGQLHPQQGGRITVSYEDLQWSSRAAQMRDTLSAKAKGAVKRMDARERILRSLKRQQGQNKRGWRRLEEGSSAEKDRGVMKMVQEAGMAKSKRMCQGQTREGKRQSTVNQPAAATSTALGGVSPACQGGGDLTCPRPDLTKKLGVQPVGSATSLRKPAPPQHAPKSLCERPLGNDPQRYLIPLSRTPKERAPAVGFLSALRQAAASVTLHPADGLTASHAAAVPPVDAQTA